MSQLNIEGDFQDISAPQLEFIKKVVEENGFKDSKVTIKNFGEVGDNYGASVKRVTVEGENGNLSMIAKLAPTTEFLRARANTQITFGNEHLMYTKFLPKLVELQKKEEIPEEELFKFPKCYGSNPEAPNEVILLEDLKCKDYTMQNRMKSLSDECVTDILKSLAVLHSFSYVLKHKEPDTYNYFKDNLKDFMAAFTDAPNFDMNNFEVLENFVIEILEDPEHKNIMKNKLCKIPEAAAKMAKLENDSRYAVILHGDAWTNNIMFKFEGETLKSSMLIDYQLSKNASPAYDLLYLLFNCTDYETRHKNFYNWLDYYHSQLDKSLSNFGLKANYVYPRDQLDADLMRYGKMMFGWCVVLCSILTAKPEEAAKFKESMESEVPVEPTTDAADFFHADTTIRLRDRVTGIIKSFIDYGLFV
ncbi:uncharacterized protein LOC118271396 [Spodoptera frugiperda]|uniref:Uncharacterized protein LOC118271396 n=1 Tax=Spodoptera frugiperda TaxID=7108 RepID=A0A9R0D7P5_SPOFR|nr:uncharacterized protein LOC118271396 [Spodoptera frugiperda]